MKKNTEINKKRILQISKELGLSHISSCITVLPILEEIYQNKSKYDKVILCGAHSHLAHLVVQHASNHLVKKLIENYGIHCDVRAGCDVSGGSLGHGGGIAIGLALADPKARIFLIETDGGLAEGSCWEAFRIINDLQIQNISIYVNANGYSATQKVEPYFLEQRLKLFLPPKQLFFKRTENPKDFEGIQGHYKVPE